MTDPMPEHNHSRTRKRRRFLRRESTSAELKLWRRIRNRQVANAKFRHQHAIDTYVLDFYCHELQLTIEVDGDSHFIGMGPLHDKERQKALESYGIRFLRFTNREIYTNIDGVLKTIYETIVEIRGEDEPSP